MDEKLTTTQAARIHGVTTRRIQALIKAGALPAELRTERGLPVWYIAPADLAALPHRKAGRPPKAPAP